MSAELIAGLLGVAVGLYAYRPLVRIMLYVFSYMYFLHNKYLTYNHNIDYMISRENYTIFRGEAQVKPRSYAAYIAFIKSIEYERIKFIYKGFILINLPQVRFVLLITLVPALIMAGNFWYYLAGYVGVVVFHYLFEVIAHKKTPIRDALYMVRLCLAVEWDVRHKPKMRPPIVDSDTEPDMTKVGEIMRSSALTFRIHKIIVRLFLIFTALFIVHLIVRAGILYFNKPFYASELYVAILSIVNSTYALVLFLLGLAYAVTVIFRWLQYYRPD